MALSIMIFAVLAFTQALVSSSKSAAITRELALAEHAARQVVETLQAAEFENVFELYDSDPGNDPDGPGTGPGNSFEVTGLDTLVDDADGAAGEIVFPEGAPGVLREDIQLPVLGMPRDLNGDGGTDGLDHSDDFQMLPVLVRVAWRGSSGPATLEVKTILADY